MCVTFINSIVNYAKGHATLEGAPSINHETLRAKGFNEEDLEKVEIVDKFQNHLLDSWVTFCLRQRTMNQF